MAFTRHSRPASVQEGEGRIFDPAIFDPAIFDTRSLSSFVRPAPPAPITIDKHGEGPGIFDPAIFDPDIFDTGAETVTFTKASKPPRVG